MTSVTLCFLAAIYLCERYMTAKIHAGRLRCFHVGYYLAGYCFRGYPAGSLQGLEDGSVELASVALLISWASSQASYKSKSHQVLLGNCFPDTSLWGQDFWDVSKQLIKPQFFSNCVHDVHKC